MSVHGASRRPPLRALAATGATLFALALAAHPATAGAATTTFTVDSTVHTNTAAATADANPADGLCATAQGKCTLRAAIDQANALPASAGNDVKIVFADALGAAKITLPGNGLRMQTTFAAADDLGYSQNRAYIGDGYYYVVDAHRPVTVDFGGDVAVESADDTNNGIFVVKSEGVTLENFKNLRGGAGSIAVAGTARDTTIRNGSCSDPATPILETCVGILPGAEGVDITDLSVESSYYFGIYVARGNATSSDPVKDVTVTGYKGKDNQNGTDIWFAIDAKTEGFTIDDADFDSPGGNGSVFLADRSDTKGLTIKNSAFHAADTFGVRTNPNTSTTDLTVKDSTFTGTSWAFVDYAGSTHDGLTFTNNTFKDLNLHVLDFVDSTIKNAVIADNDFVDQRGNGATTIWIGKPGTNNVIRHNTFTQAENVFNNRWAIYNAAVTPTANDDTGWAFEDNAIDGYRSNSGGPIVNVGRGKTAMVRNLFGPRTNGTVIPLESETGGSNRFVTNVGGEANGRIQTWRPTSASADGTNLTIQVAPITPALAGNNAPTDPVDVDVFWTATDKAEKYIGRIDDAVAGTAYVLPTDKTAGRFRVQTQDDAGRSSQYSAPVQVGTILPAPPNLLTFDAGKLQGVGQPGSTVTVYGEDGAPIGAPVTVNADGTWEHPGPFTTCQKLTAKQTDADGGVSDVSNEISTPACIAAPAIDTITADGDLTGTGKAGAAVTVRDENGEVVGTTTVGADGTWTLAGPLPCAVTLSATQKDAAGHVSAVSNTKATPECIDAPRITDIATSGDLVGDSALPDATVRVYDADGKLVGETTAAADGTWTLGGPLPCGTKLVARQTLGDGNVSPNSNSIDTAACPTAPAITGINGDGNLDGAGQPGAIVTVRDQDGRVVGTARVRANGTWEISGPLPCGTTLKATQEDADGNVSPASGTVDTPACPTTPAPAAPAIDKADSNSNGKVTGTGTPGATVKVYDQDGSLIGEALVKADGSWTVAGPAKCGSTLTARQINDDGKVSVLSGTVKVAVCPNAIPTIPAVPTVPVVPPADVVKVPTSEDAIHLQCGALPLALTDVRRGAKSKKTKRYAQTRIVGVADKKYAGQSVQIRFLGTDMVAGSVKVGSDGRFSLKVKDGDQRNRISENKRRYRAEIGNERSVGLKVTRRFDTTSVRASGTRWTVAAKVSSPYRAGTQVRVLVANTCKGTQDWKQVATARLSRTGKVSVSIAAPAVGSYQLVRLQTTVPGTAKKNARMSGTYTVARGIR